jgi:hypothetical protein
MIRRTLCSLVPLLAVVAPFGCADSPEPPDPGHGEQVGEAAQATSAVCGRRGCVSASVNLTIARPSASPAAAVFDTVLSEAAPSSPGGASSVMEAGVDASGYRRYALVQFDLSALPSATTVPSLASLNASGVRINSAYMTLSEGSTQPDGSATVNVHNVTSSWSEATATWNSPPTWDPSVAASFGNAYPAVVPDTLPNVSILSLVQGWATTPSTNHGLLLESSGGDTRFYTSEAGNIYVQPELTLIYTLSCLPNFVDCNNDETDGCEANLQTDPNNCGACGVVCPAGDVCQAGACVAAPPSCPCDGSAAWSAALAGPPFSCYPSSVGGFVELFANDTGLSYVAPTGGNTCFAGDSSGNSVFLTNFSAADYAACLAELQAACACPAGETLCHGCVDESTDPNNCGACFNVCPAGDTCQAGVCTPPPPILLASGQPFPWPLAIDGTTVYWGNVGDHTVHSVPKGGGTSTLLGHTAAGPYDMVAGPTSLFFSEDALIETVPKAGGAVTTFGAGQPAPRGIASDGVNVWWANYFGNDVVECAEGGCGQTPSVFGTGQNPFQVAVDASNVYWLDQGDGNVYASPKAGGARVQIGSGGNAGIASDGTSVYWAGTTSIFKAPVGGGATVTLLSGLGAPSGIATDGVNVYYTDIGRGTVGKCAVGGCGNAPTVLGNTFDNPQTIAVDGTSVYFADTNFGNVWQLPK